MPYQPQVRDSRQPGHFWADNEIVDEYLPTIGVYGFAVYMLLCKYADSKTGQCDPSVGGMASKLGISAPTVRTALEKLKDAGLITIRHRSKEHDGKVLNQTSIYTILAIKKAQKAYGTKPDLVPNEIDQGVVNVVDQGTKPDLVGVLNQVSTNNTHKNKTQLTRESGVEETQGGRQLDELSHALFGLCLIDPDIAPKPVLSQLRQTYKGLKAKAATHEQVIAFRAYWYSDDNWMARKAREAGRNPEPPTPEQVLKDWPRAMEWKPAKGAPANRQVTDLPLIQSSGGPTPEERRAAAERRKAMLNERATGK